MHLSTAFRWHKKLNLPPRQQEESFVHQHACLYYPNVAVLISLAESKGIPKKALCPWQNDKCHFFSLLGKVSNLSHCFQVTGICSHICLCPKTYEFRANILPSFAWMFSSVKFGKFSFYFKGCYEDKVSLKG